VAGHRLARLAVCVARSAYEYGAKWAKTHTTGWNAPILDYQAVDYMMADVAMKIEACRDFSWKAAHYLNLHDSAGHAVGATAKVFYGTLLLDPVFKTMQIMGVNALDRFHTMEKFLREAVVFPLYDAGNLGMQMQKDSGVMFARNSTLERSRIRGRSSSRSR
jgi:alkylation response protein AidB-like acyl-CoA dehydrogenase